MLSPLQIANEIERTITRLEELTEEIRSAAIDAARSETEYRSAFSQARLTARATAIGKITIDQVEDLATNQTNDLALRYRIAANNLQTLREVLRATQSQLDGLRTLSTSHRAAGA
jgi:DNA repair exonuclease SbcCD ATPase subunit